MKTIKKEDAHKALITMLWNHEPLFRNQILNSIDNFLMDELNLNKDDIPWLNKKKDKCNDYLDFLSLLRLAYARVFSEYYDRHHRRLH